MKKHDCDNCHYGMDFKKKYKNESGAEFHVYQCPICKGKVDFAQVAGGEFSVHSNIVPKEAKGK
jgi:rubredoxin